MATGLLSLAGTAYASNRQDAARDDALQGQREGIAATRLGERQSLNYLMQQQDRSRAAFSPFAQAGYGAQSGINALLGITPMSAPTADPDTVADIRNQRQRIRDLEQRISEGPGTGSLDDFRAYGYRDEDDWKQKQKERLQSAQEKMAQLEQRQQQQIDRGVQDQQQQYGSQVRDALGIDQIQQFDFQMDPSQIDQNPAYQFRMDQGLEALDRRMAGSGMRLSGNRMTGITDYAQGLASTEYDNAYRRQFGEAQAEYSSQFDLLNALMGVQGQGQAAVGGQAGVGSQIASQAAQTSMNAGANIGQMYGNIGGINAAAGMGRANTIMGGIENLTNLGAQTNWFGMGGDGLPDYQAGGQNFSPVGNGSGFGSINDYAMYN